MPVGCLTVSEGYARWSSTYDSEANPLIRLEEQALEGLVMSSPRAVLDAACRTGRHALSFAMRGSTVIGVDASRQMLAQARLKACEAKSLPVQFVQGRIDAGLPVRPRSVDLAVCALALCHLPELRDVVPDLCGAARVGGEVLVSDLHPEAVAAGLVTLFSDGGVVHSIETVQHHLNDYIDALDLGHATVLAMRELPLGAAFDREPGGLPESVRAVGWRDLPFCLVIHARVEG